MIVITPKRILWFYKRTIVTLFCHPSTGCVIQIKPCFQTPSEDNEIKKNFTHLRSHAVCIIFLDMVTLSLKEVFCSWWHLITMGEYQILWSRASICGVGSCLKVKFNLVLSGELNIDMTSVKILFIFIYFPIYSTTCDINIKN